MSISYNDLTIRGRDGRRVPVTDCTLEPLNLLIPGSAPILVPKRTAWRPPRRSSSNKHNNSSEVSTIDYDADSEDEHDASPVAERRSDSRSRSTKRTREKEREKCKNDSHVKDRARGEKHRREAERLLKQAERAREKAEGDRGHLARRIERQEAYVAKLKAKYESRARDDQKNKRAPATKSQKKKKVRIIDSDTSDDTTAAIYDSDGSATTDGSARVREMLKNMKIRAAGTDSGAFTASEDAQLLVRKKNNESWKVIMEAMGRGKSELRDRFKELQASGATIPGEDLDVEDRGAGGAGGAVPTDAAADAEGDATTDADKTGDESTDAEKTGEESKANDGGDDGFLGSLTGALEVAAEEQAADMPDKSNGKKGKTKQQRQPQQQQNKKNQNRNKDLDSNTNRGKQQKSKNTREGESGFDASASEAVADDDAGTRAYIGLYAHRLLEDARAGRVRIAEADNEFDKDDCVLLALADSRRRENRWMDIQSDFANFTGRLVPEEVLRWKLGEGERPEGC